MSESKPGAPRLGEEMAAIPYEPLLPVEKKLIGGSLITGVLLLGLLYWVSHALFPVPERGSLPSKPTQVGKP